MNTDLPEALYRFLAWLPHNGFVPLDKIPPEHEAALAVARANTPPLARVFNTGFKEPWLEIEGGPTIEQPVLAVQRTWEGAAALAMYEMRTAEKLSTENQLPQQVIDDRNWLTQVQVRIGLGWDENRKMEVSRLCKEGVLRTNGKRGRECRVDPASVLEYCNRKGLTWNET